MPKVYTERRRSEIATKNNNGPYYKCVHCGDEIFWNTHKKMIEYKCKAIYADGSFITNGKERKMETANAISVSLDDLMK